MGWGWYLQRLLERQELEIINRTLRGRYEKEMNPMQEKEGYGRPKVEQAWGMCIDDGGRTGTAGIWFQQTEIVHVERIPSHWC